MTGKRDQPPLDLTPPAAVPDPARAAAAPERNGTPALPRLPSAAVEGVEPPVFEERRVTPDRRQLERRREDRSFYLRTAAAAAIAICGGLAIVYLFFAAFGAIDVGDAVVATTIAVVMALVWLGGYLVRHRQLGAGAQRTTDKIDRERRGF